MTDAERPRRRQFTTGRTWLDVLLVLGAILASIVGVILFIQLGLPFLLFFFGPRLWVLIGVVLFLTVCLAIAWKSRGP